MRRTRTLHERVLSALVAGVQLVAFASVGFVWQPLPAAAATTICASPGKDGVGTPTGIVNTYFAPAFATTLASGATSVTLGPHASGDAGVAIAVGDLLLVVQVQASTISTANSSAYGDGSSGTGALSLGNSGTYEYVAATSAVSTAGGTLTFVGAGAGNGALNTYVEANATGIAGQQTFEVIRVPQYASATLGSALTALPWNGSAGGVLAIDVQGTLSLNSATVSVNGDGFRGGGTMVGAGAAGLANTDYATSSSLAANGAKGEGRAGTPRYIFDGANQLTNGSDYPGGGMGRGAPDDAGGGATDGDPASNDNNAGGGGGSNSGNGGTGGESHTSQLTVGGLGGTGLGTLTGATAIFMGGGGAGSSNLGTQPPNGSSGGSGGGIIAMRVGSTSGSATFNANGSDGQAAVTDGGGGGGAGGMILITSPASTTITGVTANSNGGNGGNTNVSAANKTANKYGGGGSGGGGYVLASATITHAEAAGTQGKTTSGVSTFGATKGTSGTWLKVAGNTIPGVLSGAECSSSGSGANVVYVGPYDSGDAIYNGAYYTGSYDGTQVVSSSNDFTAASIPLAGANTKNRGTVPGSPVGAAITLGSAAVFDVPSALYDDQTGNTACTVTVTVTAPTGCVAQICRDSGTGIACGTYDTNHSNCTSGSYLGWSNTMPTSPSATSVGKYCIPSTNGVYLAKFWVEFTTSTSLTAFARYDAPIVAQDSQTAPATNVTHDELYAGYVALTKTTTIASTGCPAGMKPPASGVCPGGVIVYTIDYRNVMAGGGTGTEVAAASSAYLITSPGSLSLTEDGAASGNNWGTYSNGLTVGLTTAASFPNCGVLAPSPGACGDTTPGSIFTYDAGHPSGTGATSLTDQVGGSAFRLYPAGVPSTTSQGTLTFAVQVK